MNKTESNIIELGVYTKLIKQKLQLFFSSFTELRVESEYELLENKH